MNCTVSLLYEPLRGGGKSSNFRNPRGTDRDTARRRVDVSRVSQQLDQSFCAQTETQQTFWDHAPLSAAFLHFYLKLWGHCIAWRQALCDDPSSSCCTRIARVKFVSPVSSNHVLSRPGTALPWTRIRLPPLRRRKLLVAAAHKHGQMTLIRAVESDRIRAPPTQPRNIQELYS